MIRVFTFSSCQPSSTAGSPCRSRRGRARRSAPSADPGRRSDRKSTPRCPTRRGERLPQCGKGVRRREHDRPGTAERRTDDDHVPLHEHRTDRTGNRDGDDGDGRRIAPADLGPHHCATSTPMPAPTSATPTNHANTSTTEPTSPPMIAVTSMPVVLLDADDRTGDHRTEDEAVDAEHEPEQAVSRQSRRARRRAAGRWRRAARIRAAASRQTSRRPSMRLVHRPLVGVLEIAADRHAHGDARHLHAERLQQPREIERRRFAFDVRIGRENDLGRAAVADSRQQPLDFRARRGRCPGAARCAPIST